MKSFATTAVFLALALSSCGGSSSSSDAPTQWAANGYELSPAGNQIGADRKSLRMAGTLRITPDGKTALLQNIGWTRTGGNHEITAIDTSSDAIVSSLSLAPYETFYGMAVNPAGTEIYVPGIKDQAGYVLDVGMNADRTMTLKRALPLPTYYSSTYALPLAPTPAGIAIAGNLLLSANDVGYDAPNQYPGETVSVLNLQSMSVAATVEVGLFPWGIAVTPDGKKAYVSNRGSDSVSVIALGGTPAVTATIPVGKGPAAVAVSPDGGAAYVADTFGDALTVIDASNDTVQTTISLAATAGAPSVGGSPDGLAFSSDGKLLYVALAADNAVAVIDTATGTITGRIPTGWYPADVGVDPRSDHLFVVNMEGIGHGPHVPEPSQVFDFQGFYDWYVKSTVSDIPKPSTEQLREYTAQVLRNDRIEPGRPAVPPEARTAWSAIKHVVVLYRENKTFDMEFGDLGPSRNGRPIPCPFFSPGSVDSLTTALGCGGSTGVTTPNTHALARQFALDGNFYLDVETSIQGHTLTLYGFISDYLQRTWAIDSDYGGFNRVDDWNQPISLVPSGSILDRLAGLGFPASSYGEEIITARIGGVAPAALAPRGALNDPAWDTLASDTDRAQYYVGKFNQMVRTDTFPSFTFMTFGDDHFPPGNYSENDAATATVVDAISHSPYWGSTVLFIYEDDPQPGFDHVDAERSFVLVVSPYAKHGYFSEEHYTFTSVLKTTELIFGVPALTQYDDTALPMSDLFQAVPDPTPFTALPPSSALIVESAERAP